MNFHDYKVICMADTQAFITGIISRKLFEWQRWHKIIDKSRSFKDTPNGETRSVPEKVRFSLGTRMLSAYTISCYFSRNKSILEMEKAEAPAKPKGFKAVRQMTRGILPSLNPVKGAQG